MMKRDSDTVNILFLGGAKRVSMARMFKDAGTRLGRHVNIYSYEMDSHLPIACEGEIIIGHRWNDPQLMSHLERVVQDKGIDLMVPFVDGAVGVAAEYASLHPGQVFAPCGSRECSDAMFDKVAAAEIFESHWLPVPRTWHPGEPCLRLIAKPRRGSASKGIISISSIEALDSINTSDYLIQERIDRREEYTVDCYASVNSGEILAAVPRLRVEVVGGEVSRTVTIADREAEELARHTITTLGLRGAVTVQMLRDLDTGRLMLMEINPRLGGGAVCSVHAGTDLPLLMLSEALGLKAQPQQWSAVVEIARYFQEIVFKH